LGWKISLGTEFSTTTRTRAVEDAAASANTGPARFYSSNYPAGNSDNFNDTQNKSLRRYIATRRGSISAIQDKPYALELTPEIRFEKYYLTSLTVYINLSNNSSHMSIIYYKITSIIR